MPIGILNPADVAHSVTVRPAYVLGGVNQRRYYSDDLGTLITQQDFNQLKEQILYAADYYAISDIEGDDTLLRQIIAAGAGSLTGNLLLFQGLVGSSDKVPYFAGASSMDLMTVTAFSRSLLSKTAASQWRDALGISAALSGNVVALGNLASAADLLPFFNGVESMQTCAFKAWGRGLVGQIDAVSARTYMGLGSAATRDESYFLTSAVLTAYAPLASPAFTGNPTAPTQLQADNTTKLSTTSYVRSAIAALAATLALIATSGSASDLVAGTVPAARLPTSLSTIHALVPATDRISYYASSSTAALTALTAFGRSLIDDIDAPTARGTLGLGTAAVRPDTYFAPIDSPTFTGTPTAPTPSGADSSTRLATTAFVAGAVSGATSPLASIATSGSATDLITGTVPAARLPNTISALHGLTASSNEIAYYTSATTAASTPFTAYARTLLDDADATTMRATLGLVAVAASGSAADLTTGTLPSARLPTSLSALYTLTPAADRLPYYSGASTSALATFTAFGRTLIDDADAAAARATLGVPNIAGDTFTGDVVVRGNITANDGNFYVYRVGDAAPAFMQLQTDVGFNRQIASYTGSLTRWNLILANGLAEGGSNIGSDFQLNRFNDAGTLIDSVIYIPRSTGIIALSQTPTHPTPTTGDNTTKSATTAFVATNFAALAGATFTGGVTVPSLVATGGNIIVDRVGDAAAPSVVLRADAGQYRQIVVYTGTTGTRWDLILADNSAESGGNAGSNFALWRYNDAGVLVDAVISIPRATGIMALSQIPTHPTPTAGDSSTKSATTGFVAANFAALAGATFTGAVTATTVTATLQSGFVLDRAVLNRDIRYKTSGIDRWALRANATAEGGSNAGSDFQMLAFDDAGVQLGGIFTVARSSQVLAFANSPTAPTPAIGDSTTKLATTAFVDTSFANLAGATFTGQVTVAANLSVTAGHFILNRIGDASPAWALLQADVGQPKQITAYAGLLFRWNLVLANGSPESGSNAGSDFVLQRYNDAGTYIDNPFSITRSTGIAAFSQSPIIPTPAADDNTTKAATTEYVQSELTAYVSINNQVGTTITVATTMYGTLTTLNNAGAQTCALPAGATLAVPAGTWIDFMQIGAGQCTFSAGAGATVTSRGGLLKTQQWGIVRATKRATNLWVLSGDGLST